ncbi:MAG: hypothetical protein JKY08_12180 [Flavobacteriaceae bacterium]|nr:hypothetical protein [Flavobacteriaceae bacterium]
MKKLNDFKKNELTLSNLFKSDGDGLTRYRRGDHYGADTYEDENQDGVLSSGDTVPLDDGSTVCP